MSTYRIPPEVAKELLRVPNENKKFFFWNTGEGKSQSAVTNWQHDLREVFARLWHVLTGTPICSAIRSLFGFVREGRPDGRGQQSTWAWVNKDNRKVLQPLDRDAAGETGWPCDGSLGITKHPSY